MIPRASRCFCYVLILLTALNLLGCCGNKKNSSSSGRRGRSKRYTSDSSRAKEKSSNSEKSSAAEDIGNDLSDEGSLTQDQENTSELYEKMDYAHKMYKSTNYDGALREVERILQKIDNDPYLEMQVWGLSAMIHDKAGRTSRRKRSYRKMIDCMEQLQKDPRFRKSFEDGKECQELIEMAKKNGDKKNYAED